MTYFDKTEYGELDRDQLMALNQLIDLEEIGKANFNELSEYCATSVLKFIENHPSHKFTYGGMLKNNSSKADFYIVEQMMREMQIVGPLKLKQKFSKSVLGKAKKLIKEKEFAEKKQKQREIIIKKMNAILEKQQDEKLKDQYEELKKAA